MKNGFPSLPKASSLVMSKSRALFMRSWFALLGWALFIFTFLTFMTYEQYRRVYPKPKHIPTIYVLSHRRSGTHLTMDLLSILLPPPVRIVKAQHLYLTNSTAEKDVEEGINCRCFNFFRRTGKMVHAHRDVRDVVISSFYYMHSFKAQIIKNLTRTAYLQNENGVRDMIISKWVNTTVPYFAQPDILQMYFTDSLSGFEHIYDRIATFFGVDHMRRLGVDPRQIKSASKAVLRHGGRGDHGYKLEMTTNTQNEVMKKARALHEEARRNMVQCPPRTDFISRMFDAAQDAFADGFWIGGKQYGLFAPSYCPSILERSKVVITK